PQGGERKVASDGFRHQAHQNRPRPLPRLHPQQNCPYVVRATRRRAGGMEQQSKGDSMNHEQQLAVRHAAIDKLASHGIWLARTSRMGQIAPHIEAVTGKKRINSMLVSDYV